MLDNLETIEKEKIYDRVSALKKDGYRFAALTCEKQGEDYELFYHFDLKYQLTNIKVVLKGDDNIKSISELYPAAFLIENEIQDFYGIKFTDLIIDYKGKLYLTPEGPKKPLA